MKFHVSYQKCSLWNNVAQQWPMDRILLFIWGIRSTNCPGWRHSTSTNLLFCPGQSETPNRDYQQKWWKTISKLYYLYICRWLSMICALQSLFYYWRIEGSISQVVKTRRLPLPHCLPCLIDAFGSTGNLTVGIHSVSQKLQVFKAWNTSIKRIVFQDKAIPKDDSNWVKLDKFNKYLILLLFALKKPACFRDFPHQTWEISAKEQTKEVSDDYPWMTIRGANFMWCYQVLDRYNKTSVVRMLYGCQGAALS